MQDWMQWVEDTWNQYWPHVSDMLAQPPPLLWILLGVVLLVMIFPRSERWAMNREDMVRRIVSDRALDMLEHLADEGTITWKEAEREMIRMGRNYSWGDLIPKRTQQYQLTEGDIKKLKGLIQARRNARKTNGQDVPMPIPDEPKKKKLSSGKIGRLISRHRL